MKKALVIITAVFFGAMGFLSLFAREIHNSSLPRVTAARPETRPFPTEFVLEDGTVIEGTAERIAVTREQLEQGIFVLYYREKNGERRAFVRSAEVVTGQEAEGCYEIVSGIGFSDRIAVFGTEKLFDGCEVIESTAD